MGDENAILAWQFKDAQYMWGQNVILTLWPYSTLYIREENAKLTWQFKDEHCMSVIKYNIDIMTLNPHYMWEKEIQYLHDNLNMHIISKWQNVILALWP
jgi:hypothetical protein